jgi:hypothetical protein
MFRISDYFSFADAISAMMRASVASIEVSSAYGFSLSRHMKMKFRFLRCRAEISAHTPFSAFHRPSQYFRQPCFPPPRHYAPPHSRFATLLIRAAIYFSRMSKHSAFCTIFRHDAEAFIFFICRRHDA